MVKYSLQVVQCGRWTGSHTSWNRNRDQLLPSIWPSLHIGNYWRYLYCRLPCCSWYLYYVFQVHSIEQLITCKGLIQIWRIDGLTNERDWSVIHITIATTKNAKMNTIIELKLFDPSGCYSDMVTMVIFRCYSNPKIQYSIGICHEWGIIRDMKWCPSGTSDSFEVSLEDVRRCGLLAIPA